MKRSFTKSEKFLFLLCGGVIMLTGIWFLWDDYRLRMAAAQEKIESLEPRSTAAAAAAATAPAPALD